MKPGTPTFEQLSVFVAVAEEGSFAGAAKRLGRAVSVISYAVLNLETQLGFKLFERHNTRKPVITSAGRAVLLEARSIARGFDNLHAKTKGLLDGLEAEVNLAIDVMLPCTRIGPTLRSFRAQFPTVSLCLQVEALGAVTAMVLARDAVIGVSGPLAAGVEGIDHVMAGSVPMVPVASPDHPLARAQKILPGEAREHTQLVLSDRSGRTRGRDFAVVGAHVWRLGDIGAKHALLRDGVGWGNMPLPLIERDLRDGSLFRLAIPDHPGGTYRFSAIWRRDTPPGPAASWLLDQFVELGRDDAPLPGFVDL